MNNTGQQDWIKSREYEDDQGVADGPSSGDTGTKLNGSDARNALSKPWIHAPNDAVLRNTPCPICQEKFESTWSENIQDWIWQDAVKVGNRVYHDSCLREVTKDGPAGRVGTPESVLGKRKAEEVWHDKSGEYGTKVLTGFEQDASDPTHSRIKSEPVS